MYKFALPLLFAFAVAAAGCSSSETVNQDEVPDVSPAALYQTAQLAEASGDYPRARRYLEAIASRYPFGELSEQVQLDLIYVYYKSRETDLTTAQISRYLRLSPTSQYMDYVTYMKGLNELQKRSDLLQDFLGLDRAQKDPTHYYEALKTFNDLIETYPYSPYVMDARQRMVFIRNQLAEREMAIAEYYNEREAYLSAIRHCQAIIYSYSKTEYLLPALELMSTCYRELGLELPAQNAEQVYAATAGTTYIPSYTPPAQVDEEEEEDDDNGPSIFQRILNLVGLGDY